MVNTITKNGIKELLFYVNKAIIALSGVLTIRLNC